MPYSDTDEYYDVGVDPPMSRQVYDWYQQNVSPIGQQLTDRLSRNALAFANAPQEIAKGLYNAPSTIAKGISEGVDWAGKNVALPALQGMQQTQETDWSNQPFISTGEHGELTGRIPALAGYVAPYLLGAAPAGSGVLPAGVKLPGGKYGYPEGYEGGYHGTHAVFASDPKNMLGRFWDKYIGSGEGAQVFGWGHYIGAKKGTGASYMPSADEMALHIGDEPWNPFRTVDSPYYEQQAHDMLIDAPRIITPNGHMPDVASVVEDLKASIADLTERHNLNSTRDPNTGELHYPQLVKENLNHLESDKKTLDFIEANQDKFKFDTPGSLYHVEMKPPEESLMHWDKKLKDQEPEVLEKLKQVNERIKTGDRPTWEASQDTTAGDWYREAKRNPVLARDYPDMTGDGQALSEAMKEAGIPGLRFADQHSRPIQAAKGMIDTVQTRIDKYQKILDEDLQPGHQSYQSLMEREGGINNINDARATMQREKTQDMLELESYKKLLKDRSTLQFDGKPINRERDIYDMFGGDIGRGTSDPRIRAMIQAWDAKDVDKAIGHFKAVMRVAREQGRPPSQNTILNQKAVDWLEKNRDKISLKEPDITHNYVIFDPKDLNIIHREKNMPKGYI